MNLNGHLELREQTGAYVLDLLGEAERTGVDHHRTGCAKCRAEVHGQQPVAAAQ